jgi:hypothetical protein
VTKELILPKNIPVQLYEIMPSYVITVKFIEYSNLYTYFQFVEKNVKTPKN